MPHDLLAYFEHRFSEAKPVVDQQRSFITISRETGCNGTIIAKELVQSLKSLGENWKFINKELLEEAALKLKVDPSRIKYIFESKKKSQADEMLAALSNRYYKNDNIIRKTIFELIGFYARQGNVIIVGRGGAAIAHSFPKGLHIRLVAPLEWRINSFNSKTNNEYIDPKAFILESDMNRSALFENFCQTKINDFNFDLTINCACFTQPEIVKMIIHSMEIKKIV